MTNGESNLSKLLAGINPRLHAEEFVYAVLPNGEPVPRNAHTFGFFVEDEGTTLILERAEAERCGIASAFPCRMITLTVHSSLEAVGFLAAIAAKLTEAGISANTISAYYHDHLLVPADKADAAMAVLRQISQA